MPGGHPAYPLACFRSVALRQGSIHDSTAVDWR
jgi:hypothetical protein